MNKQFTEQESEEMVDITQEIQISDNSVHNINDTKKAEWVSSQVGYKNLFENMPNGCAYYKVLFDNDTTPVNLEYIQVNSIYEKNMGRPLIELVGKRVTEVFPHLAETSFQWIKTYMKVALFGESVTFTQYLKHQDKWYSIFAYSPHRGYVVEILEDITEKKQEEAKRDLYIAKLLQDITEQKNAETLKNQNQRQVAVIEKRAYLGALSAGVAHQINQPLQALKIMADGMIYWYDKGKETNVEKVIENCRRISVQAGNITTIIERMQDFVDRSYSDSLEQIDLNKMVKQAICMVEERLRDHGVQLIESICAASPTILGDVKQLEKMLIIILVHAVETLACVDQNIKEIAITTSCVGKRIVIEISNNAPTIPDDILMNIFEPFFHSSKSGENQGLGLVIAKSIVNANNGTIQASSVNQKVTFQMEFPIYR